MYQDRTERTGFLSSVATEAEDPLGWGFVAERATPSESVYCLLYNATDTRGGCLGRLRVIFVLEAEGLGRGVGDWHGGLGRIYRD